MEIMTSMVASVSYLQFDETINADLIKHCSLAVIAGRAYYVQLPLHSIKPLLRSIYLK